MFESLFGKDTDKFLTLKKKLDEIYSLLQVARSDQQVVIKFYENNEKPASQIIICGKFFKFSHDPIGELHKFHNVLSMKIDNGFDVKISLE